MDYAGLLYRALNPVYAADPLSGQGAALHGGRFNPRGMAALYVAMSLPTALREANQVGHLQPTTLIAIQATVRNLFDTRDESTLGQHGLTEAELADPGWRDAMLRKGEAPTQTLARKIHAGGHAGMVVRSFARGADALDFNMVLWRVDGPGVTLEVIDDHNRLSPKPS
jgi:RES domain-containing protein